MAKQRSTMTVADLKVMLRTGTLPEYEPTRRGARRKPPASTGPDNQADVGWNSRLQAEQDAEKQKAEAEAAAKAQAELQAAAKRQAEQNEEAARMAKMVEAQKAAAEKEAKAAAAKQESKSGSKG